MTLNSVQISPDLLPWLTVIVIVVVIIVVVVLVAAEPDIYMKDSRGGAPPPDLPLTTQGTSLEHQCSGKTL